MILCRIDDSDTYEPISATLSHALQWLRAFNAADFSAGELNIGRGVVVKFEEPALRPREAATLETHRQFIDIHVPLKGTETIGWAPAGTLRHERAAYDADSDIAFWGDAAHSLLHVKVGQMAIFFPADAHAPNIGLGNHRKLCIKIPAGG